jgi:DNA-binding NtrC family response regulator
MKKKTLALAPSAIDDMLAYDWPGNVRELQNCVERAVILTDGDTIHAHHLALSARRVQQATVPADPWDAIDLTGSLDEAVERAAAEAERRKIEAVLRETGGNQEHAAERLRITPRVLVQKLREHHITTS